MYLSSDCDPEERRYGNSCYRFIRDARKSRNGSHEDCVHRHGHLVYVESEGEQTFLATVASSFYNGNAANENHYWIGLIPTRTLVWLDGSPVYQSLLPAFVFLKLLSEHLRIKRNMDR